MGSDLETQHRYRLLLENIKDFVFELDNQGNFIYISPNWGTYFGVDPEEYVGKSFVPLVHPDDLPICMELLQRVVESGERGESGEYRVRVADGSWRWHQSSGAPVFDADGKIVSYVGVARDVTEQREIRNSLEVRTTAMEASIDGIAVLDSEHNYVYLNHSHAAVYGYDSVEELLGRSWKVLYTEDELARLVRDILPQFAEHGQWRGEATGLKKDGSTFPQEISLTALEDGGLICVVRDITPLSVARMSLQNALGEKEVLLREFQHRVKNSFHMIMSMVSLRRDMQETEEANAALKEVEKRVKALADLYTLLYTTDSLNKVDLGSYCKKVSGSLTDLYSPVLLEEECDSIDVPLNFAASIGLILIELITNSLKYAFPEGRSGTISVKLDSDSSAIRLIVADDGIGIPGNVRSGGTGLELVRGMVKQHRGKLERICDNGTRFEMLFPVV